MINHMNPYMSSVLAPQQILQANGKASIDALKMAPNSSVLIADNTAPIVWKCVSDGLGNVTAEPFDISPHKTEEEKQKDDILVFLNNIDARLKKLEEDYEQSLIKQHTESNDTEFATSKKVGARGKKSPGIIESDDAE